MPPTALHADEDDRTRRVAYDGPSGIAATFSPDIVILDIAMPDMSGYEVARALRTRVAESGVGCRHRLGRQDRGTPARERASIITWSSPCTNPVLHRSLADVSKDRPATR